MACPNLSTCPFFNDRLKNTPAMAGMIKKKYCHEQGASHEDCARWIVFKNLGPEAVLSDLFPNQKDRALQIINQR